MSEVQTKDIETIAYVVHNPKEAFVLEDVVLDEMRDDEVLVDMKFSGICHTVSRACHTRSFCSLNPSARTSCSNKEKSKSASIRQFSVTKVLGR